MLLFSPDCRGRPHAQASCWYLYGCGGCSRCYPSPRLHPLHCWEWRNRGREIMGRKSQGMFCKKKKKKFVLQTKFGFISTHTHTLTCSWSCIYSLLWPETWWTGESHSHQKHRALERLEKPLHRSSGLKPESLKPHKQTNRQTDGETFFIYFVFFIKLMQYLPKTLYIYSSFCMITVY